MELSLRGEGLHLWRGERHVLRGLDVQVNSGEILQVRGANGTGKTTLLRTLSALSHPEEGRVLWKGHDVRRDLPAFHDAMAYLGHESPLKADLSPRENLHYWAGIRRRISPAAIDAALDRVGCAEWRERAVRTLSAGQRRRVALAGLIVLGAVLWILDEPTTNLDQSGQELVGALIREHASGGGLVVAAVHHELVVGAAPLSSLELQ